MLWLLKRNFESIGAAVEQIEINAAMHKLCKQETPSITLPFTTLNWDCLLYTSPSPRDS